MLPATAVSRPPVHGQPLVSHASNFASDLSTLVEQFSQFGRRIASRHGLDPDEVDEVLQDVRIRLWRAASAPGGVRFTNAHYVYKVVVSASLDLVRKRRRHRARLVNLDLVDPGVLPIDARTDALIEANALGHAVQQALLDLPPDRREAVRLGLQGHDRFEIARLKGWSVARARNLLYRGLADLRSLLTAQGIAPDRAQRAPTQISRNETIVIDCAATRLSTSPSPSRPTRAA